MYSKSLKMFVAGFVVVAYTLLLAGTGYAEGPTVKLIVNPNRTDVSVGSEAVALTAKASGSGLQFTWKLQGPGKIEGSGSAIFYHIPEIIEGKSAQALVTVTVTDDAGQETTETFTFNILAKETTATATPAEPEKEGMSMTTKVAIGAGAAVLVGAGVALAASGGDKKSDPPFKFGWWNVISDWYCDGYDLVFFKWNLKEDKTFESSGGYYGTWSVSGSQITVRYHNGTTYTGMIDSNGTQMEGNTVDYNGVNGCWAASYGDAGAKQTMPADGESDNEAGTRSER